MKTKVKFMIMMVLAVGVLVAGTACSAVSSFDQTTAEHKQVSELSAEGFEGPVFEHEQKEDTTGSTEFTDLSQLEQLIENLGEIGGISSEELDKLIVELKEIESIIAATDLTGELSLEHMIMELVELGEISTDQLEGLIAELEQIETIIREAGIEITYSVDQITIEFIDTGEVSGDDYPATYTEEYEDILMIPMLGENAKVRVLGGIHGSWGYDDSNEPSGWIVGIYGTVYQEDGSEYGFLGGIAKEHDSEMEYGYLLGQYSEGEFWGTYYDYNGGIDGEFVGTYGMADDGSEAAVDYFSGIWESNDGESRGYLEGNWAQKACIGDGGEFGGKWFNGDIDNSTDMPEVDGKFRGHYAIMKLIDGTEICLFRGGWHNAEGAAGKLAGLGIENQFYGIWHGQDEHGYMTGTAEDHRLEGAWGTFGEGEYNRLYGEYGPRPRCEQKDGEHIYRERRHLIKTLIDRVEYLEERVAELESQIEVLIGEEIAN